MDFGLYTKAIAALVVAVLTAVATAVGNGEVDDLSGYDWVKVALVILGGSAVTWFAENGAAAPKIKAFLGAVTAGLTAWVVAYENDGVVTQGEWLTAAGAVVVALTAVYQLANKNASPRPVPAT